MSDEVSAAVAVGCGWATPAFAGAPVAAGLAAAAGCAVGAAADVAVWSILRGEFGYGDAYGGRITGSQRLICEMTLRDGRIVWDWNARAADDYRKLDPSYGIRPGIDQIIPPK